MVLEFCSRDHADSWTRLLAFSFDNCYGPLSWTHISSFNWICVCRRIPFYYGTNKNGWLNFGTQSNLIRITIKLKCHQPTPKMVCHDHREFNDNNYSYLTLVFSPVLASLVCPFSSFKIKLLERHQITNYHSLCLVTRRGTSLVEHIRMVRGVIVCEIWPSHNI